MRDRTSIDSHQLSFHIDTHSRHNLSSSLRRAKNKDPSVKPQIPVQVIVIGRRRRQWMLLNKRHTIQLLTLKSDKDAIRSSSSFVADDACIGLALYASWRRFWTIVSWISPAATKWTLAYRLKWKTQYRLRWIVGVGVPAVRSVFVSVTVILTCLVGDFPSIVLELELNKKCAP